VPLETPRQILRRLVPDDAAEMFALNSDPEVIRHTFDAPPASIESERAHLVAYQDVYRDDGFARLAAIDRASGEFLGWCGLRKQPDGEIDIGYRYKRAAWGRGFATEASRVCLAYGFRELGLARIIATAFVENVASIHVLEKLGLVFEERFEQKGQAILRYAIAKSAWPTT
jgi:RimJ/RimL family protein N-acetyltransferase